MKLLSTILSAFAWLFWTPPRFGIMHLAAWYESIDPANALVAINAVRDDTLLTNDTDVRVPRDLTNIIAAAALGNDASLARAQLQSPSLRSLANIDLEPLIAALVFGSPPEGIWHPANPIVVVPDEALNLAFQSDPAAAAVHQGFVVMSDGPAQPVNGDMFTVRATSAIALVAGSWVSGELAFGTTLPAGRYQVVGMRARGTNLVAARLIFRGASFRPGVFAVNAVGDEDHMVQRFGRLGVFGEFESTTPPAVEAFGVTDAAQTYLLDLIKTA